jgi:sulfoxide reductase heme-binding subunit YedZ
MVLSKEPKWRWLLVLTHIAALAPLALLLVDYATGQLSFNPIREITLRTGRYALILLVLSLACTPVRILTGWSPVIRLRRPLGLYAFMYAALHLLTFVGLDFGFNLSFIWEELIQRRYLQVGLLAFLILLPLAVTSTRRWIRKLGKNWNRLHRLVYLAALLVFLHFLWAAKGDIRRPITYVVVVVLLLAIRALPIRKAIIDLRGRIAGRQAAR